MQVRKSGTPGAWFRKTLKSILSSWQLYVLIAPAVIYLILFSYVPMYGVQIAFKDFHSNKGIVGSEWVGLQHFIRFVTYPNFWTIVKNTVTLSFYNLILFPLSLIVALMLNEVENIGFKKTAQMVIYAPHFMSTVVICSMVTLFFSRANGLVNNVRELMGLERIAYMESPAAFKHLYIWSGKWQNTGWDTIIYISALASISPELIEAAKIDGANRLQIIWHVNIPTILPTVIIMLILKCGHVLSVGFEKVYLLQNSLNLEASQIISTYVYTIGLQSGQYSYSSAIDLFNTVINIIFVMTVNAISKRVSEVGLW